VTTQQSATMNILHNVNKLSIRQIHEKFPKFSLSTVFRHATQASDNLPEKKKKVVSHVKLLNVTNGNLYVF
jgi:hypothetical protein